MNFDYLALFVKQIYRFLRFLKKDQILFKLVVIGNDEEV